MKPKHTSLIALILSVTIVGLVVGYEVRRHKKMDSQPGHVSFKPLSEIKVPDRTVLAKMDRMERKMHLLSTPPVQYKRQADLSCLGYLPLSATPSTDGSTLPDRTFASSYRVSMAFDGRANRYCMVDGHLYAEGDLLPDGAAIEKIESRRVLITNENLQQWLLVEPVFDTALSDKSLRGDSG